MHAPLSLGEGLSPWQELRRGWKPLVACSVGIGLGLSPIPPFTAGIFATALNAQFGWPRGEILAAIILVTIGLVLLGSSVGRLVDRVGARRVAIGSTICLGLCLMALGAVGPNILSFYAVWAMMAVFALGTLPVTYAKVVTGWFDRARGVALGLALASTGVTGALYPFYIHFLMDRFGWRIAYVGVGLLPLLIALPILLLWLRECAAPGEAATAEAAVATDGLTVRAALRRYRFWASALAAMALGAGTGGLMPNLMPMLTENGLSAGDAARALALLAVSVTIGRLLSGFMLDRIWAPLVAVLLVVPAAIGVLTLTMPGLGLTSAMIAVGIIGLVAGAEFDLIAYITGRYFGQRHFSELYGIQYAVFGLGSGTAPALYGTIRDMTGSYLPALFLSVGLLLGAVALLLTLGRYPADSGVSE
ncbi:Major Facilitator Superfamily protein [Sphingobium sp. AP50]|uniref:MFS transporter n=1 Tax=Sphingobium sp. AP50 TaxID=1884369 RepID=UPI0008CDB34E|nr:MFS transporter [Sphingobium sp. AP50]SEJ96663.1 Major Facilitator Superfamily protein [Sphingobium sp. AP50]